MRWLFIEPPDPDAVHARELKREAIARWWQAFVQQRDTILASFRADGPEFDLPSFMHDTLHAVHPDLMWEFGPAVDKEGHRLVVTPEGESQLRPLVDELLGAAPELPDWEFGAYRLPDLEHLSALVEGRTGQSVEGLVGRVSRGRLGTVNLEWTRLGEQPQEPHQLFAAAFTAAEVLLGEEFLDRWVGAIKPVTDRAEAEGSGPWLAPAELASAARRVRRELEQDRPEQTFAERFEHGAWTALSLKPEPAEDYARFDDQLTGQTMALEMWETARRGLPFCSERFSRHGERFAALKIDVESRDGADRVANRSQLEDVLQPRLVEAGLGSITGAGLGLRYDYIDLALTDVAAALPLIRGVLRRAEVSKRSWILFFDSEWRDEWVGIWDDTPPPPNRDAED